MDREFLDTARGGDYNLDHSCNELGSFVENFKSRQNVNLLKIRAGHRY